MQEVRQDDRDGINRRVGDQGVEIRIDGGIALEGVPQPHGPIPVQIADRRQTRSWRTRVGASVEFTPRTRSDNSESSHLHTSNELASFDNLVSDVRSPAPNSAPMGHKSAATEYSFPVGFFPAS